MEVFDNLRSFFFTEIYNTNIIGNEIVIYNFNSLKLQHVLQRVGLKSLRDLSLSSLSLKTQFYSYQSIKQITSNHSLAVPFPSFSTWSINKAHIQRFLINTKSTFSGLFDLSLYNIIHFASYHQCFKSEKCIYGFYTIFSTRQPLHRVNHFSKLTVSNIKKVFCQLIKMVFLSCFYLIIIMDDKVYNI